MRRTLIGIDRVLEGETEGRDTDHPARFFLEGSIPGDYLFRNHDSAPGYLPQICFSTSYVACEMHLYSVVVLSVKMVICAQTEIFPNLN